MDRLPLALLVLLCGAANGSVAHRPLGPRVEPQVRSYVHGLAETFGVFYPDTVFRDVRAVYFQTGAVIVCGELNKLGESGEPLGWRYFSNSGPLIFESDKREVLCDRRRYALPAVTDDYDYAAEFTLAAQR